MKHLRVFAGAGVVFLLAACATTREDDATSRAMVVEADGLTTLPSEAAAEVKTTTGLDATRGRPIYEPEGVAPAFFEIETEEGWAVVTADAPAHVVEYGRSGRSPTARLDLGTRAAMKRVYRLDTAIYIAADAAGNAIGRTTKSLLKLDRSGERATFVAISSDDALKGWRSAKAELASNSPLFGGTAPAKTCTVKGDVPSYKQLSPGEGPNTTACASGCGPTAWATVFGWAGRRAAANATDAPFAGLFPNAPLAMNGDVGELSMQLNRVVGTFCTDGGGATTSWAMGYVESWVAARAPGVQIDAHYNILMMPDNVVRDAAIDTICDGRPSIVGTGSLFGGDGHYPIAKGYSNGRFELEMGWGGDGNGWYDAKTWYAGSVRH